MDNPYVILGIRPGASKKEIKQAYRKIAKRLHPDINKSLEAEEKFKKVNRAYEFLINDGMVTPKQEQKDTQFQQRAWVENEKETLFYLLFGDIIQDMLKDFK